MRTSRADNNYLSVNAGVPDKELTAEILPENPEQYDAILKVTGMTAGLHVEAKVAQGSENVLDVNNESDWNTFDLTYGEQGQVGEQVITCKGGSSYNSFKGLMQSRGKSWDIRLGDWSDQSTTEGDKNDFRGLKHVDGQPIRIVVGRHSWPTKADLGENCEVLVLRSVLEKAYWWTKYGLVKSGAWSLYLNAIDKAKAVWSRFISH